MGYYLINLVISVTSGEIDKSSNSYIRQHNELTADQPYVLPFNWAPDFSSSSRSHIHLCSQIY